jgi:hypothetical protein
MQFFLPHASNEQIAEQSLEGIRRFVSENMTSSSLTERRIFRIRYRHDGFIYEAEVGKRERRTKSRDDRATNPEFVGEEVIAILDAEGLLFVCTPSRGVLGGLPILVGRHAVLELEYFEGYGRD